MLHKIFTRVFVVLVGFIFISALWLSNSNLVFAAPDHYYYTAPISFSDSNFDTLGPNSYFDHTSPRYASDSSTIVTRYDGATWSADPYEIHRYNCTLHEDCYNGHNGIDFNTSTDGINLSSRPILAAAPGEIVNNEHANPTSGYGYYIRISHPDYGPSGQYTLYAHLATESVVIEDNHVFVTRGQHIANSGKSGGDYALHLHFSVFDFDSTLSTYSIDPYGWSGGGSDPWARDVGYLWTTQPTPSLDLATVSVSSTISGDTVWEDGRIYIIGSGTTTLASGSTLSILPGTIIKFATTSSILTINGNLDVNGTTTSPVYFTSLRDDIGGDTDNVVATPSAENWKYIYINNGGSADFDHAVIRYGGADNQSYRSNIVNFGGSLNITNSTISNGYYGVRQRSSTPATITNSTVSDNSYAGIYAEDGSTTVSGSTIGNTTSSYGIYAGNGADSLTATNNTFSNNLYPIYFAANVPLTESGNTAINNTYNGKGVIGGNMAAGTSTWAPGSMPFVLPSAALTITSNATLSIDPGTVIKFKDASTRLYINGGNLDVNGTTTSPVYFTSIKDDLAGGDTDNDDSSLAQSGDWKDIYVYNSGIADFNNAIIRYGGSSGTGYSQANIYNYGGSLALTNATTSNSYYGIRQSGTSPAAIISSKSVISGNSQYGIYVQAGSFSVTNSTIAGNTNYGLYSSVAVTADDNWWGDGTYGPRHTGQTQGTGDWVTTNVDHDPFLSSAP
jgi:hypothetical protein